MSPQRPNRSESPFQKSANSMFGGPTATDSLRAKVKSATSSRQCPKCAVLGSGAYICPGTECLQNWEGPWTNIGPIPTAQSPGKGNLRAPGTSSSGKRVEMAKNLVDTRGIPTLFDLPRTETAGMTKDPPVHRGEKTPRSSWRAQYWKKATPWVRSSVLSGCLVFGNRFRRFRVGTVPI